MADDENEDGIRDQDGIRDRVTRQGEEAIGRIAQDLLKNPLVSGTISAAFDARERATRAQELALGALNLPSAADLERLTRRLRSISQRIEGLEEGLDRLVERMDTSNGAQKLEQRLSAIEETLSRIESKLSDPTAPDS
jgi:chromosome segregation ATPase